MPAQPSHMHRSSGAGRGAAARTALVSAVAALAVGSALAAGASAAAPTVDVRTADIPDVVLDAGAVCPFPVTFTSEGEVRITTFQDGRTSVHGSLEHTIFRDRDGVVLHSRGPAPVHVDATTGEQVTTGMNYAFHLRGVGVVLASAGRPDGVEWRGLQELDAAALCAALAPPE